jgi:hypothetical protein
MAVVDDRSMEFALGIVVALAIVVIVVAWRARMRRRVARRRARRALAAESAGERLLVKCGYEIVERQARIVWGPVVDGEIVEVELRLDLIVEKDGERLVAEIKSGSEAPRFETAATRRQLLEYLVAARVAAVLLVEPENGVIRRIEFPITRVG